VAYHHASGRNSRDSAIVRPHSGVGGRRPEPEEAERGGRLRIVKPIPIDARTMIGDAMFGSTCSTVSRHGDAPSAAVLSTKTSFCSARSPRRRRGRTMASTWRTGRGSRWAARGRASARSRWPAPPGARPGTRRTRAISASLSQAVVVAGHEATARQTMKAEAPTAITPIESLMAREEQPAIDVGAQRSVPSQCAAARTSERSAGCSSNTSSGMRGPGMGAAAP